MRDKNAAKEAVSSRLVRFGWFKASNVRIPAPSMLTISRATFGVAFLSLSASAAFALPNPPELIPAQGGPIRITPVYHASMQIEYRGKVIQVDPFSAGDYSGAKKADLILITHTHPDHLDPKAIDAVRQSGPGFTEFVVPEVVAQVLRARYPVNGRSPFTVLRNGQLFRDSFVSAQERVVLNVQAVPAYNLVRGPKPGLKFHPKGEFNGYVLTLGGKRIYIAGDTEATPEMKALKNIDVAFIPMNLPYTMTPQEAAGGVKAFKPKVVYPYHYRFPFDKANDNPQQFARALAGSGIQVRLRGWYAHPAPE